MPGEAVSPTASKAVTGGRRLFFALWPAPATAHQLDEAGRQAHESCGGRRMRRETLHLTLAFIGAVAADRIEALHQAAAAVAGTSVTLKLDTLGCWRHIVWAGCGQTPPALTDLANRLQGLLREAGFALEDRSFAAHVTLLRDARRTPLPQLAPIVWPAAEFVLAASRAGGGYELIGRWPLAPGHG